MRDRRCTGVRSTADTAVPLWHTVVRYDQLLGRSEIGKEKDLFLLDVLIEMMLVWKIQLYKEF